MSRGKGERTVARMSQCRCRKPRVQCACRAVIGMPQSPPYSAPEPAPQRLRGQDGRRARRTSRDRAGVLAHRERPERNMTYPELVARGMRRAVTCVAVALGAYAALTGVALAQKSKDK